MDARRGATVHALLRVAGDVAAFHPTGAPDDWDAAVEAGCAAVADGDAVAEVVAQLLALVGDPATGVRREATLPPDRTVAPASGPDVDGAATREVDGVTVVDGSVLATIESTHDLPGLLDRTIAALPAGGPVVLDLRGCGPYVVDGLTPRLARLVAGGLTVPGARAVTYPGYGDERGWVVTTETIHRSGADAVAPIRFAVVVDAGSSALRLGLALRAASDAVIVQHGTPAATAAPPIRIQLDDEHVARIRTCEATVDGRPIAEQADAVVALADDPVAVAVALVEGGSSAPTSTPSALSRAGKGDTGHWSALARLDRAIRLRFPYHHLLDEPWEQVVDETAVELAAETTAAGRERALARAVVRLCDGHALLYAPTIVAPLGRHRPDVYLVDVDGKPIVAQVGAGVPEIEPGDEVVTIDGATVSRRRDAIADLLPASTPHGHAARVRSLLLAGAEDTDVVIGLVSADGRERSVAVRRTVNGPVHPTSAQPVWTVLESGVGYIDVGRLAPREVEPAFTAVMGTDAVVLDLRRYPRSAGMLVASRLADRTVCGARLRRRMPTANYADATPWWHLTETDVWMQQLVHPDGARYPGRVVSLIDEGTISQGEHTALFLEAAADAVFVGAPTNGTNGNVASVELGGDMSALYTGIEVTHGDGRQLQRIGVLPKVSVAPTRAGLAARVDEVLEAGVTVAKDSSA